MVIRSSYSFTRKNEVKDNLLLRVDVIGSTNYNINVEVDNFIKSTIEEKNLLLQRLSGEIAKEILNEEYYLKIDDKESSIINTWQNENIIFERFYKNLVGKILDFKTTKIEDRQVINILEKISVESFINYFMSGNHVYLLNTKKIKLLRPELCL